MSPGLLFCFGGLGFAVFVRTPCRFLHFRKYIERRDQIVNFFNNGPHIVKLIIRVHIYHILIDIHLEKKNWFENWIYKKKKFEHL